jgi:hypothetical protein
VIRRVLALGLFLLAGTLAVAPRPTPGDGVSVWTAGRSLPAGTTLSMSDVVAARATGPPDGALPSDASIAGRVLAGPVRRGEILTDVRLVGPDGPDPGPGRIAVPVRPADPGTVELLSPGTHVAVVGVTQDGTVRPLTDDAVVLAIRRPGSGGAGSVNGMAPGGSSAAALVVLSVPSAAADAVTAMALTGSIGFRFA